MTKVYKSKIGLELFIPIALVFLTLLVLTIINQSNLLGLSLVIASNILFLYLFLNTFYEVDEKNVIVKCGFLFKKTIVIHDIKKISETTSVISSPATSLDRLEISYGKFDSILISPKQKKEFIEQLISINPTIEVKLKGE